MQGDKIKLTPLFLLMLKRNRMGFSIHYERQCPGERNCIKKRPIPSILKKMFEIDKK